MIQLAYRAYLRRKEFIDSAHIMEKINLHLSNILTKEERSTNASMYIIFEKIIEMPTTRPFQSTHSIPPKKYKIPSIVFGKALLDGTASILQKNKMVGLTIITCTRKQLEWKKVPMFRHQIFLHWPIDNYSLWMYIQDKLNAYLRISRTVLPTQEISCTRSIKTQPPIIILKF